MRYNIDIVESQIPKSNETGIKIWWQTIPSLHLDFIRNTNEPLIMLFVIIVLFLGMSLSEDTPPPPCSCTIISFMETCKHVYACPILRPVVQVECQIIQLVLQPEFTVNQLIIHGDCDDIEKFKKFCSTQVKGIVMQRSWRTFICSGI